MHEPFAALSLINHIGLDKVPYVFGSLQVFLVLRVLLIFVIVTYNTFCLYPPYSLLVHYASFAFVRHRVVVVGILVDFRNQVGNNTVPFLFIGFVAQGIQTSV